MNKIEHIGIAVKSIEKANIIYKKLLGYSHYKTELVEKEGVLTSFFICGESKIELLEASQNKLEGLISANEANLEKLKKDNNIAFIQTPKDYEIKLNQKPTILEDIRLI